MESEDGSVLPERVEDTVDRFVGPVAEPAQGSQSTPVADESEGCGVHVQFVTQGGEDGVSHLGGVRRGGQGPGHGLHALGGLRGHPSATLVACSSCEPWTSCTLRCPLR